MDNPQIASQLLGFAQLLASKGENPYKIRAYRRAAETIKASTESIDALVHRNADLTQFNGIGKAIANALREIVLEGKLKQTETLRANVPAELAELSNYPRLDPERVLRAYKKLGLSSIQSLKRAFERGEIAANFGARMQRHFSDAFSGNNAILLSEAAEITASIASFLLEIKSIKKVEPTGPYRRRLEVIDQLFFLLETPRFEPVITHFKTYGEKTDLVTASEDAATFKIPSGLSVTLEKVERKKWGLVSVVATGSPAHLGQLNGADHRLEKLALSSGSLTTERAVYKKLGLSYIEPELREGNDEVARAETDSLPTLIVETDICGELHAHSTSSDGDHTIEQMAEAAQARGYRYLGISDHSQSLKIAYGVSADDLRKQIREIDKLNRRLTDFRVLKAAEVDILADGKLDYANDLLEQLDYTVCSIHSKFNLSKKEQTERILRAMDNPYFNLLGHATGRRLLVRAGYELDFDRIIKHAKERHCFFEINANPNRLDLAAPQVRLAKEAGIKIAICTDAHATSELANITWGIDQARRAGLEKADVLNTQPWSTLRRQFRRS